LSTKTEKLLSFLRDAAKLRRKRIWDYSDQDRVLWLSAFPATERECNCPFHNSEARDAPCWLTVKKPHVPSCPDPPAITLDWIAGGHERLENYKTEPPELRSEITIIAPFALTGSDDEHFLDSDSADASQSQTRSLSDFPGVERAWLEYVVESWLPWATEMQRLEGVRNAYESLDTMRRRLEEAAEFYELVLAVGLLQWRDSTGKYVSRHLITASADIDFVAEKGMISIVPSASFDTCRLELDMLEPQDQPRLDSDDIEEKLGELGIELWNGHAVGRVLSEIANRKGSASSAYSDTLDRRAQITTDFCISFAPAIVLRQRRLIAYDDLLKDFIEQARENPPTTTPWRILIGETDDAGPNDGSDTPRPCVGDSLRYLPLATNEEQEKIIDRLERSSAVVVKGPPGTGKSHTIANLMCHLLAKGERVLVTAHAPKALSVLLEKLPGEIAALCVSALASSKDDMELLKKSVAGIMQRWNDKEEAADVEKAIDALERERLAAQSTLQKTLRAMREVREAESYQHALPGGYAGTASAIAQQLEGTPELGWLSSAPNLHHDFPLAEHQLRDLAEVSSLLTSDRLAELTLDLGSDGLPTPDVFEQAVSEYRLAIGEHKAAAQRVLANDQGSFDFSGFTDAQIRSISDELQHLDRGIALGQRVFGSGCDSIAGDLLSGRWGRYRQVLTSADSTLIDLRHAVARAGDARIEFTESILTNNLKGDAQRRFEHFRDGGRRGFLFLKPAAVRETAYIEKNCRVDGKPPRGVDALDRLAGYFDAQAGLARLREIWPHVTVTVDAAPAIHLVEFEESFDTLRQLVDICELRLSQLSSLFSLEVMAQLIDPKARSAFVGALETARCFRREQVAKSIIVTWLQEAKNSHGGHQRHPVLDSIAVAIGKCQPTEYAAAWNERNTLASFKHRYDTYGNWLRKLDSICPGVQAQIEQWQGDDSHRPRILNLDKAFCWSAAKAWLVDRTKEAAWEQLSQRANVEADKLQSIVENLASQRAWASFFGRIRRSQRILKDLEAWSQAQQSIGRGTGRYAFRHRQEAQGYLNRCVSEMPAWIMPLHKVWENATAKAGLFDTVIIDEASQAGVDSLLLLMLAKRIIVVGDNMQNSPEGVGVSEDDLGTLVRTHLKDFDYGRRFRPDSSLFDHAKINCTNMVSLREHFRCVPEIIRFSNDHFYSDTPLIPLRQRPPQSLPPLRYTFVEGGTAEGESAGIRNRIEAEKLVECIEACLNDPQYEGKTMGVIALQGHAQAELIEGMLRDRIDPVDIAEAKIRCGGSATFQGDQRDVMFLSMVVAPNKRYTARTTLADQRRYNVAVSRARDQVWVFHSVAISDLSRDDLRQKLLRHVYGASNAAADDHFARLEQLEAQAACIRKRGEQPPPFDSWFEVDVALELLRRQYRLRPQYEVDGRPKYRIDLVIEGTEGRLAVECDGDYHLAPEQIERDLDRQRQLERAEWEFMRVPESDFYVDRGAAIRRIEERCQELRIFPESHRESVSDEVPLDASLVPDPTALNGSLNGDSDSLIQPIESSNLDGPFSGYDEACAFPDPRVAATTNIRQALTSIIEKDGPLSLSSILRLYREGCPAFGRAAKIVQSEIRKALGVMKRMGLIEVEDELDDGSLEGRIYRLCGTPRVRERPAGCRRLEEIPPSEIISALLGYDVKLDDLERCCRQVLEHYGFQRLTVPRREYLKKVVREACRFNVQSRSLSC
jgi:very-short-patch-repair endonuclease